MSEAIHHKYLAVNPTDLKWGAAVNSVGCQEIGPDSPYPPTGHPSRYIFTTDKGRILNEFQLLYITRGRGTFSSESLGRGKSVTIKEGDMFLLFPGEWHTYGPDPRTGWKEYWIGFDGSNIRERVANGFFTKNSPILNVGLQNDIVELYQKAISAAGEQKSGFQQLLAGIVDILLGDAYFYDKNHTFKIPGISEKINMAKTIISEKYSTITPQEIAKELYMSYSNFRKVFKQYTGFSPAQYIQDIRMNRVKEILTNTDLTIKGIAYKEGFDNYEYFLTAFKANAGVSPSQYRALTQGENTQDKGEE